MSINKDLQPNDSEFGDTFFSVPRALSILQSQTPQELVQVKKGFGKGSRDLDYVSVATVTRTLNKAFGLRWSFKIHETRVVDSVNDKYDKAQNPVVQTLGELIVPGLGSRMQWGSQTVIGGQGPQEHTFKGSASDALKKCASLFLVHLDLADGGPKASTGITPEDIRPKDLLGFEDQAKEPEISDKPEIPQPDEPTPDVPEPTLEEPEEEQEEVVVPDAVKESIEEMPEPPVAGNQPKTTEAPKAPLKAQTNFSKEDVDELKGHKERLGIKNNDDLDPYAVEFFGNETATYRQVTPNTIKDFNHWISNK